MLRNLYRALREALADNESAAEIARSVVMGDEMGERP